MTRDNEVREEALKETLEVREEALKETLEVQEEALKETLEVQEEAFKETLKVQGEAFKETLKVQGEAFKETLKAQQEALKASLQPGVVIDNYVSLLKEASYFQSHGDKTATPTAWPKELGGASREAEIVQLRRKLNEMMKETELLREQIACLEGRPL